MKTMKLCTYAALSLVAMAIAAPARAQDASAAYGFPIGEKSRIHTKLDLGVGFDSNPERTSAVRTTAGTTIDPKSDWKALIRPGLDIDVPGTSFALDFKSQLAITQYFGTSSAASDTFFGGVLGGKLRLGAKTSPVAFRLEDSLVRTPTYIDDAGTFGAEERRFKEWNNRGTATLVLKPGGGALELDVGYTNMMSLYDSETQLPFSQRHGVALDAKLRFLPKTAAVFHTDFSFFSTDQEFDKTKDSTPYNVTLGLVGQVTARISANVGIGFGDTLTWQNGFFSDVDTSNKRTLIATVEGTYEISDASRFTLGYRRQVQPVIVLNNYRRDAIYAKVAASIGARLVASLYGQYEMRAYPSANEVLATATATDLDAQTITADARVEYWFFEFLNGAISYRLIHQTGTAPDPLPVTAAGSSDPTFLLENYTRHEIFMFAGLKY